MNITTLLRDVPWKVWYDAKMIVRKNWADREMPEDNPALVIKGDVDGLQTELKKKEHFEDAEYEYYIKGQEWGMRRAEGISNEGTDMELHIRAFVQSRGILILAHWEPNRYSESGEHIDSDHVHYSVGADMAREVLEDIGYSPTRVRT